MCADRIAAPRIVLYGATGYTGGLVLDALAGAGVPLVLAGRSASRLRPLAERHDADVLVADAAAPDGSMEVVLRPGNVVVSTVGPFTELGAPAVEAAVRAGAHYVDSTGEGPFIRRVFEEWGPRATGRSLLLPAFGYDFVPGNLAAGLALRDAGSRATAVDVGYFNTGATDPRSAMSSGTTATTALIVTQPRHVYRDGRLTDAGLLPAKHRFLVDGKALPALEIAGTEAFDVPATFPHVRDVGTYLGWFGPATDVVRSLYGAAAAWARVPVAGRVAPVVSRQLARRTGVGPDEEERAASGSLVVAEARDADGQVLATVRLEGPNGYTLTGAFIAWAAVRLATDPPPATGAHGPVGAFGLDDLEAAAADMGLRVRARTARDQTRSTG